MLKKLLVAFALVLPFVAGAQTIKIGLVDAQAVIQDLPAFKTAQTNLEEQGRKFDDEYQKIMKEAQTKFEEFRNLPADTPDVVKETRAKELQDYEQKLGEFQQMAQQALQKAQAEALQPLYQQIQNAIQSIGKEGGYTIIQDKSAVLYFGAPAEDITPQVKARLGIK